MKKIAIAALICLPLTACVTTKIINGPNGQPAQFIKCGSSHIENCYEEAAKLCPKGYDTVTQRDNPNATVAPVGAGYVVAHGRASMMVQCKPE